MTQVYFGEDIPWDSHHDILVHRKLAGQADRPIAALIMESQGVRSAEGNRRCGQR